MTLRTFARCACRTNQTQVWRFVPLPGVPVSCSWHRCTQQCGLRRLSWRRSTRWRWTPWRCGSAGRSERECHVTPRARSENVECYSRWILSTIEALIHYTSADAHTDTHTPHTQRTYAATKNSLWRRFRGRANSGDQGRQHTLKSAIWTRIMWGVGAAPSVVQKQIPGGVLGLHRQQLKAFASLLSQSGFLNKLSKIPT